MEHLADQFGRVAMLEEPQLTKADIIAISEGTAGQIKSIEDRRYVVLRSGHNPGSGVRRMYTGGDALQFKAAIKASAIGIPMRVVSTFADLILDAAFNKFRGTDQQTNRGLALYPLDDDWQFIPFSDQRALNVGDLPIGFNIMQIDKLIDQVTASITAIAEERQLPDFSVKPINDYGDDFFMKKDSDADGREVLVGLTFEETAEYRDLSNRWMTDRIDRAEKKRHAELNTRHEAARLRRMGQTFDQRMAEAKGDA